MIFKDNSSQVDRGRQATRAATNRSAGIWSRPRVWGQDGDSKVQTQKEEIFCFVLKKLDMDE